MSLTDRTGIWKGPNYFLSHVRFPNKNVRARKRRELRPFCIHCVKVDPACFQGEVTGTNVGGKLE